MKKFTQQLINTYHILEQEAPADLENGVSAEVPPVDDIPPVEDAPVVDATMTDEEIGMLEKVRQALLINRDEIDSDEISMIYSPITPENASDINDVITSILNKSLDKTAQIEPSGHY